MRLASHALARGPVVAVLAATLALAGCGDDTASAPDDDVPATPAEPAAVEDLPADLQQLISDIRAVPDCETLATLEGDAVEALLEQAGDRTGAELVGDPVHQALLLAFGAPITTTERQLACPATNGDAEVLAAIRSSDPAAGTAAADLAAAYEEAIVVGPVRRSLETVVRDIEDWFDEFNTYQGLTVRQLIDRTAPRPFVETNVGIKIFPNGATSYCVEANKDAVRLHVDTSVGTEPVEGPCPAG